MSACTRTNATGQTIHKRQYERKRDAKRALRMSRTKYGDVGWNVYRCTDCGCWHVGRSAFVERRRVA